MLYNKIIPTPNCLSANGVLHTFADNGWYINNPDWLYIKDVGPLGYDWKIVDSNCLTLNGTDNYLFDDEFVLSGENTLSFWIYLDDINKVENFVISNTDTDSKNLLYVALDSSNLAIWWRRDDAWTDQRYSVSKAILLLTSSNTRYHIIGYINPVTWDQEIYINNTIKAQRTITPYTIWTVEAWLYIWSLTWTSNFLWWRIADFRLFNRELTTEEKTKCYQGVKVWDELIHQKMSAWSWLFSFDSSTNWNHWQLNWTWTDATLRGNKQNVYHTNITDWFQNGISLYGLGNVFYNDTNLLPADYDYEIDFYQSDDAQFSILKEIMTWRDQGNKLLFRINTWKTIDVFYQSTGWNFSSISTLISAEEWVLYKLKFQKRGTTAKVFVDSVEIATRTNAEDPTNVWITSKMWFWSNSGWGWAFLKWGITRVAMKDSSWNLLFWYNFNNVSTTIEDISWNWHDAISAVTEKTYIPYEVLPIGYTPSNPAWYRHSNAESKVLYSNTYTNLRNGDFTRAYSSNYALTFNGSDNGVVSWNISSNLWASGFSIHSKFKPSDVTSVDIFTHYTGGWPTRIWRLWLDASANIVFSIYQDGVNSKSVISDNIAVAGVEYDLKCTRDGTTMKMYVNDVLQTMTTTQNTLVADKSTSIRAWFYTSLWWYSWQIYVTKVRTQLKTFEEMNNDDVAWLEIYWTMSEWTGATVFDYSWNWNNWTINGTLDNVRDNTQTVFTRYYFRRWLWFYYNTTARNIDSNTWDITQAVTWWIEWNDDIYSWIYFSEFVADSDAEFDTAETRTWFKSLKLSSVNTTWSARASISTVTSSAGSVALSTTDKMIQVDAVGSYRFDCYVKTNNIATDWAFFAIFVYNDLWILESTNVSNKLSWTNDWTLCTVSFTTTNAKFINIVFYAGGSIANAWFDINWMEIKLDGLLWIPNRISYGDMVSNVDVQNKVFFNTVSQHENKKYNNYAYIAAKQSYCLWVLEDRITAGSSTILTDVDGSILYDTNGDILYTV